MDFTRPSSCAHKRHGFTLVELLVVIGIIAVLISILLPTLNRVREQGKQVACQSNLRQIGQLVATYQATNKGQMPIGRCWAQINPTTYGSVGIAATGQPYSVNAYYLPTTMLDAVINKHSGLFCEWNDPGTPRFGQGKAASPVWRCPSVPEGFNQPVSYAWNFIAFPAPQFDGQGTAITWTTNYYPTTDKSFWVTGMKASGLYPDTALFWDTSVYQGGSNNGVFPYSWIDFANLLGTGWSACRFRYTPDPAIGRGDEGYYAQNVPIWVIKNVQVNGGPFISGNSDYGAANGASSVVLINAARFRHSKDTVCNVLFADGSVRGLKLYPNRDPKLRGVAEETMDNEFLRKYLMVRPQKAPPNLD